MRRIDGHKAYRQLTAEREVVLTGAPAFVFLERYHHGPEGEQPHALDWLEIFVVTSGHGYHLSPRGMLRLQPGSVVALRPGVWQVLAECDLAIAEVGISPQALATDLVFLRSRPVLRDLLFSSAHAISGVWAHTIEPKAALEFAAEIEHLAERLSRGPQDHVLILGQLIVALGTLARALPGSGESRLMHPAVETALELLEGEPERPWRMSELARAANVHVAHLAHLFRAEVGTTPMAHLARIRVERAAALLADRDISIAHVGAAVGWPDAAHFSRRFRELMGVSPRQYRFDIRRSPPVPG
jgi:AraC family L-rhamnose operon transcriptional activator RhaR